MRGVPRGGVWSEKAVPPQCGVRFGERKRRERAKIAGGAEDRGNESGQGPRLCCRGPRWEDNA
jgi:hypothetical protein